MKLRSKQYPVGHILNPLTPYVPACRTDLAATFARVRELREFERERAAYREAQATIAAVRLK